MEVSAWVGLDAAPLAEAQDSVGLVEDCLEGKEPPEFEQAWTSRSFGFTIGSGCMAAGNWPDRRRQTCSQRPSACRIYRSVDFPSAANCERTPLGQRVAKKSLNQICPG
jgi:hypothetical protein